MELDRMLKALGEPMRLKIYQTFWKENTAFVPFPKSLVFQNLLSLNT